jgi:tRNA (guanine-N7-)-methyltransferase
MARGRHPARLRVSTPEPALLHTYFTRFESKTLYFHPERFPVLDSPTFFHNDKPLHLDAGCGSGEFICECARTHPENNYIGIDTYVKGLYKAVHTAHAYGLDNVHFVNADIKNAVIKLTAGRLSAVYVLFPTPVLQKKHRKYQIVTPSFLDHMARALLPDGTITVCTDSFEFFEIMKEIALDAHGFSCETFSGYPHTISTYHCTRWQQQGRDMWGFILGKHLH